MQEFCRRVRGFLEEPLGGTLELGLGPEGSTGPVVFVEAGERLDAPAEVSDDREGGLRGLRLLAGGDHLTSVVAS
jgi:hypothetical protein